MNASTGQSTSRCSICDLECLSSDDIEVLDGDAF